MTPPQFLLLYTAVGVFLEGLANGCEQPHKKSEGANRLVEAFLCAVLWPYLLVLAVGETLGGRLRKKCDDLDGRGRKTNFKPRPRDTDL